MRFSHFILSSLFLILGIVVGRVSTRSQTVTYPVADIVTRPQLSAVGFEETQQLHDLADIFHSQFEPESWGRKKSLSELLDLTLFTSRQNWASGSIHTDAENLSLVVRNRERVHRQIQSTLTRLRSPQPKIRIEIRTLTAQSLASIDLRTPQILNHEQMKSCMSEFQRDRRSNILFAPKLIFPSGEGVQVGSGDRQIVVTGHVAHDRKSIQVKFVFSHPDISDVELVNRTQEIEVPIGMSWGAMVPALDWPREVISSSLAAEAGLNPSITKGASWTYLLITPHIEEGIQQ
ncbi:hypothetical protein [Planctomicrobium piriforme]|uniref:Uncharacterized protein n=1 Tax=Planctomicrobium piriforme TaxID=1576369 RepID=A0A1I3B8Y8_9PLAN|nr:hypothetical protein [Planctomicrobium piriforme]SFH58744.1 hypothetical protein SAMN05421753_101309 [Planctomicrobium piriforme]